MIHLRLLGRPSLQADDATPVALERHDAALLALLALQGPMPRKRAIGLLWPDVPLRAAQTNLRQRLFRLKQRAGGKVVSSGAVLALAAGVAHDLDAGTALCSADLRERSLRLLGELEYDDDGELGERVAAAREHWRSAWRDAVAREASRLEADDRIEEALAFAEHLIAVDPLAEHAHRRTMRLHYRSGDRAAALAAYARCRDVLERELGTEPDDETRALAALVERSERPARVASVPLPVTFLRPPRLVGRDTEWALLSDAWRQGRSVLITGEAGIGKSRLAGDFVAAQHAPHVVRAHPGDAATPYALLARLLRAWVQRFGLPTEHWAVSELARLLPELGAAPAGALEPIRLRYACRQAFEHWRRQGLHAFVVDDLHFADDASLESMLGWMAERLPQQVVLTVRAGEMPRALATWLEDSRTEDVLLDLALGPLDEGAIRELVDSVTAGSDADATRAEAIARRAGGNPFFILETLMAPPEGPAPVEAAPDAAPAEVRSQVGRLLDRRLAQLPADALRLARLAALAGTDFSVDLAARVLGCHAVDLAEPWQRLVAAQVFRGEQFAHDLVSEAARRSVPTAVAKVLHGAIAAALEHERGSPARIASHWRAAQAWGRAASQFERAAEAAHAAARPNEALDSWNAAAECHRAAGTAESGASALACEWHAVRLLCGLGSLNDALARAEAILAQASNDRELCIALEVRAHARAERVEPEAALADASRAMALAERIDDTRLHLLAIGQAANASRSLGRPEEAVALQRAHASSIHVLDDEEQLEWLGNLATALDCADRRIEAVATFDAAIERAEALGRWDSANALGCNKAIALMYLNRHDESIGVARRAIESGRRAGLEDSSLLVDTMNLAGSLRDTGRFDEYLAIAEPLPAALRAAGYTAYATNAENDLAGAYSRLGRHDLAMKALGPVGDDLPPAIRAARLFTLARLLRGRRMAPGAKSPSRMVQEASDLIAAAGGVPRTYVRLRIALELAQDAPPAEAAAQMAAIEAEARSREQFMLALHALTLQTDLLRRAGRGEDAARTARVLADRCRREGTPAGLYAPEAWWIAAQALEAADPGAAKDCLARAATWIEHTAAHHVPAVFVESFLTRNAVNAAVRAAAARAR